MYLHTSQTGKQPPFFTDNDISDALRKDLVDAIGEPIYSEYIALNDIAAVSAKLSNAASVNPRTDVGNVKNINANKENTNV